MSNEELTLGQYLQKARKNSGMSLDQLAVKTKINLKILKALESDDLDSLPSRPYVRGFVQNICKVAHADLAPTHKLLERLYIAQNQTQHDESDVPTAQLSEDFEQQKSYLEQKITSLEGNEIIPDGKGSKMNRRTVWQVLEVVFQKKVMIPLTLVLIAAWGLHQLVQVFQEFSGAIPEVRESDSSIDIDQKAEELQQTAKSARKAIEKQSAKQLGLQEEVQPHAGKAAALQKSDQSQTKDPKAKEKIKEATKEQQEEQNPDSFFPDTEFRAITGPLFSLNGSSEMLQDKTLLPDRLRSMVSGDQHYVYLVANKGKSWLSYKVDDKKVKRFVLEEGKRLLLRGSEIALFLGNFNAVTVFYDNRLVEAQTSSGVKSLVFPPEASSDYEIPLFIQGKDGKIYTAKQVRQYRQTGEVPEAGED